MILVAGGDSFVWGSELGDCNHDHVETLGSSSGHSSLTFPAILGQDYEYQCCAYPGNGNDTIARNVIIACEKNKEQNQAQVVSVTWTFPGRYEFHVETSQGPNWETINTWTVGKKYTEESDQHLNEFVEQFNEHAESLGIVKFAKSYFANVGHLEYWETYTAIKEIVYLQNYLKANNIQYLFTCADVGFLNNHTIKNADDTIRSLYNQIDFNSWFLFPKGSRANETVVPRGFYQWALENKYSIGPMNHPLEKAHQDAALLIKDKFNELVQKNN